MSDQFNTKKESLSSSNEKIQESPSGKSGALSYSVASNPVYYEQSALHVLFAGASQTLPGHAVGPKLFDYYLLHYVEKGAGTFRTELHTYELSAGDCFLIHPGQLVSYQSHARNPWQYRWIAFTGSQAAQNAEEAGFRPEKWALHMKRVPVSKVRSPFFMPDTLVEFPIGYP